MKKILSLLMVVFMLSVCMVPAFAAGVTVTAGTATGEAGDEVSVTFTIPETTFATFAGTVTYDSSALTLKSLTGGAACPGTFVGNANNGMVSNLGFADETKSGVLFTATFTIKEGAEAGFYSVGFDIINFTKADTSSVDAAAVAGSVTVKADAPTHEHSWTCKHDDTHHWDECSCGETKNKDTHKASDWQIEEEGHWWGCIVGGCGYNSEIEPHDWNDGVVTTEPTVDAEGVKTFTCTVCEATKTEAIEKLPAPVVTPEPTPVVTPEPTDDPEPTEKPADPTDPTEKPADPTEKPANTDKSPKTSGEIGFFVMVGVMTLCAAAVVVLLASKKTSK